jgi:protein SCO1/2
VRNKGTLLIAAFGLTLLSAAGAASGQSMTGSPATAGYRPEAGQPSATLPRALREIGFDQNLNQPIPLDTRFRDESGRSVRIGEYFGRRPVVLLFAYYDCPMLCTQVINGLAGALIVLSLDPGQDFEIVTVSFDPRDTPAAAAAKKAHFIERYRKPGAAAAWHFLTGDPPAIERLTRAAGFRYAWDEDTKQFAHPSGVIVLTPDGRLARYLFGIEYGPRDLRFAIIEAADGRVGNPADALLLYCFHYDPMTGKYGLVIMRVIRLAGIATVLAIAAFIVFTIRRERQRTTEPGTLNPAPGQHPEPGTGSRTPNPAAGARNSARHPDPRAVRP